MPFYSYICKSCLNTFELFKKIDDREEPTKLPCPVCNAEGTIEINIAPVMHKWKCSLPTNS